MTNAVARVGQSTSVEQSRAVAEVQAAIVVAQQCPRDVREATRQMKDATGRKAMADRAFYSFPRAGHPVTGPSVYLARELARCWGNIQYGLKELARDDVAGESEMMVYAWDVQTNTRSESAFIVKHQRDSKDKAGKMIRSDLVELRDIYENNANNGARRLREAIMAVLPQWFVEEAKDACWHTLRNGEEGTEQKPLPVRIDSAIKFYESTYGITVKRLERKVGRKADHWTDFDVAQLLVIAQSVKRGEITLDEAVPEVTEGIAVADVIANAKAELAAGPTPEGAALLAEHGDRLPPEVKAMIVAGLPVNVIKASDLKVYNADGSPAEPAAEPSEPATPAATPPAEPAERGGRTRKPREEGPDGWPKTETPGGKK